MLAKWLQQQSNELIQHLTINESNFCFTIPRTLFNSTASKILTFNNFKNLNKKSKTLLSKYRHCEFLDTLKKFKNTIEVNESYTSKTCSNCGYLHKNLSNKDIYDCESCKIKIGRDINASRNVMLRYFTNRAVVRQPCGLAPE